MPARDAPREGEEDEEERVGESNPRDENPDSPPEGTQSSSEPGVSEEDSSQSTTKRLDEFIDSAVIVGTVVGGLYIIGLFNYTTYFSALGIDEKEIIFPLHVYVSNGFIESLALLPLILFSIYDLFLADEERNQGGLGDIAVLSVVAMLLVYPFLVSKVRLVYGIVPVGASYLYTVLLYSSILALVPAVPGLFLRGSVLRRWTTKFPGGKLQFATIALSLLLVNSGGSALYSAEQLKSGQAGGDVSFELVGGGELPLQDQSVVYHVITHDSRVYLIEIWGTEGNYSEAVYAIPSSNFAYLTWNSTAT